MDSGRARPFDLQCGQRRGAAPTQDFVTRPTYSNVKISPSGDYLARTGNQDEQDIRLLGLIRSFNSSAR